MIGWGWVFSEFYFLAAFDFEKCREFLDRYDAQRLLLLGFASSAFRYPTRRAKVGR